MIVLWAGLGQGRNTEGESTKLRRSLPDFAFFRGITPPTPTQQQSTSFSSSSLDFSFVFLLLTSSIHTFPYSNYLKALPGQNRPLDFITPAIPLTLAPTLPLHFYSATGYLFSLFPSQISFPIRLNKC